MPQYETTRKVKHSARQMFDLVADVECYPQFVPMCESLKVRTTREKGDVTMLVADMTVGYKRIRETFTCQVMLRPEESRIEVSYIDGPFKYLDNKWTFEDLPDGGSKVHFYLDYEFKSMMLGALMGAMFDRAFKMFAEAFERRADQVYGTKTMATS